MSKRALNPERSLFALSFDGADPWGSALSHQFAIAEALTFVGENVPASWEYRQGLGSAETVDDLEWPTAQYVDELDDGSFSANELRHFGTVLARYIAWCAYLGLDY